MDTDHNVSRRDFLQRLSVFGLAGFGAGSVLTACGGSGNGEGSESASSGGTSESQSSGGGSASNTVTVHPKGNQMKFKETEFTVPADTEVKLVFENTATSPSMQHNVLVLNAPPEEGIFKEVGQAAVQAGASKNYVPDHDAIIAATGLAKPGETTEVTFTTPSEPGDYGYVCTFPGHWATMQGTMHVQ